MINKCPCGNQTVGGPNMIACTSCGILVIGKNTVAATASWNRITTLMSLGISLEKMPRDRFVGVAEDANGNNRFVVTDEGGCHNGDFFDNPVDALANDGLLVKP